MTPQKARPARPRGPVGRAPTSGSSWPWWVVGAAVILAGVVAVALSAGGGGGSGSSSGSKSSSSAASGPTAGSVEIAQTVTVTGPALPSLTDPTKDPAVGKPAPTLTGVTFKGTPVTIGNTGRPHLVVMVAHWCPHCQAEVPRLVSLAKAGQIPVPIVTVATGTDSSAPNYPPSSWLQRAGWPFPVLVDTSSGTAAKAYGLPGYPFLVFVDAQGNVVGRLSGEVSTSDLTKLFTAFVAGKPLPIPGAGGSSAGR